MVSEEGKVDFFTKNRAKIPPALMKTLLKNKGWYVVAFRRKVRPSPPSSRPSPAVSDAPARLRR